MPFDSMYVRVCVYEFLVRTAVSVVVVVYQEISRLALSTTSLLFELDIFLFLCGVEKREE